MIQLLYCQRNNSYTNDYMNTNNKKEWLLLIHQIPPKPDYFRVKIWRRLLKIGAVAIKQSVYVLPDTVQAYEDLHWIVKEISEGGGTASLSKAVFHEGLSNRQVESLFQAARDEEYEKIIKETQSFMEETPAAGENSDADALKKKKELARIQNRFNEIRTIDFFNAPGHEAAQKILTECDALLRQPKKGSPPDVQHLQNISGQTWVTRKGIYVDRIASAWLILRFIDPTAHVKFVADDNYQPQDEEIRFDMYAGEFTHIGDACTFEVLVNHFGLASHAMTAIAEIIHDIDLKDKKFGRPETNGIQAVFSGMSATCSDDQERLERGSMLLNELYASFEAQ